ncbi:hypothetical protein ACFSKU_04155 [Pontibacter silvestris]|uniref:Uncharacterized protein n=1 Tax=Pontibacter silvestris TaxID=2305183 RepID=A0ABW4WTG6_9BACT|nr:hypothetical protein [Pontibacter silvestris]MCC9138634.1 hypothetical protein [Pontibacter silvestris]
MTTKVNAGLQQYEELVESGEIETFAVLIQDNCIIIEPAGSVAGMEMPVIQELLSSIRAFFYGVKSIEYGSFDYTTLRSFINARMSIDRIVK